MITIRFDDGEITVRKITLEKCDYFHNIFQLNPEDTVIDMYDYNKSLADFRYVLNFLITSNPIIPYQIHQEIDFYGVNYPRYNTEDDYPVTLIVRGVKFKCNSLLLMQKFAYINDILIAYYIGSQIHIDRDPKEFKHILCRISDSKYVIPSKYAEKLNIEIPALDIVDNNNLVPVLVCGTFRYMYMSKVIKSPIWKEQLLTSGYLKTVFYDDKLFDSIYTYLVFKTGLDDIPSKYRNQLCL